MGFLFLTVACSLGIATLFKLAERRDLDRTALLAGNYAAATGLAALQGAGGSLNPAVAALGAVEGVFFIGGFWMFALAIRRAGVGLAAAAMRLSVVVPVVASWAVWGEAPTLLQGIGLGLAGAAFVLLARPRGASGTVASGTVASETVAAEAPAATAAAPGLAGTPAPGRTVGLLALLFVSGGLADFLLKVFQTRFGTTVEASTFLLLVFGVGFVIGAAVVVVGGVRTGRWPRPEVLLWGTVLGVLNYAAADFLLRALGTLPAPVAFPLNSVSIVLGAALLGGLVWGERFSTANVAGLVLAALAVALLAR